MKSIRIGNDIRIEWPIVLSGDVSKLQDLDLTVEVRPSAKIIDTHNYADEIRNNDNKRLLFEKHETTVMMNGGLECRRDIGDGKEHCRPRPPRPCPPRPIPPAPVKLPYHIEDNTLIAMWTADRQFATGDYDIILYAHKNEGGQAVCDQYRFVRLVSHTAQADAPDDSGIEAVIAMQPVTLELSGLSAYEVAVINGFQGTEEEWLASLKKPAEDAAEELKQEIEQFKEDTKEELQADIKALGYYEDNPEFIRAYTDAEGKFLWGIRVDGSIEWAKGVPTPVQNALKELADKIKDLGGDKIEEIETTLNEKIEALQDAIDVINASLKTLTDTFSYQDNPEFVNVVTDAEGKVLFGIKEDGKPYFPKNTMYSVESNQEFLAAWLDAAGHVLFGLRQDGSTYVAKADFLDKIEEIRQLLEDNGIGDDELKQRVEALEETFTIISNDEWLHAIVDAEGKLLFGIKAENGEVVMSKQDTYKVVSNDEWLAAWLDATNKILFGVKADGTFWAAKSNYDEQIAQITEYLSSIEDVEDRSEITLDAEDRILAYRDKDGIRHESKLDVDKIYQNGKEVGELASKEDVGNVTINASDIPIAELDGVQDHSLPNLFDKTRTRAWDSDFADKVFAKIGRKTANTGCYSNNIEAKEGDWFTRNDFGTGIVVALDENEDILGDVANAAYQPTIQIVPSDPSKYDFSKMKYVVFVVMVDSIDSEIITKAKYVSDGAGDYITVPKLRIESVNVLRTMEVFFPSTSGKYYKLQVDDSVPTNLKLNFLEQEGIPTSNLPEDFPYYECSGDFSEYLDGLVMCPIRNVADYLVELTPQNLVRRYFKKRVNCPRILKEGNIWYYYGVDNELNASTGKLNIYKADGETFIPVHENLGGGANRDLLLEPHDCLVISVNPLHYIYQRYVSNQYTKVNSQQKRVTALHVGEVYEDTLLWEWHSEDYGDLWIDSHVQGDNADYLHNNTIGLDTEGNVTLNNKQANQILVLERTWHEESHTASFGDIKWKIGGNRTHSGWDVSNRIKTTTEQQWAEPHDAICGSDNVWHMYDNRTTSTEAARILEFEIDEEQKTLKNFKSYTFENYGGRTQGSVQKLAEGIYLVSWGGERRGNSPAAGIYDFNQNKMIWEIRLDMNGSSLYRVYGIPKGQG